jgi:peptidyl-prolyl cis-trans isomerase D
MQEFQVDGKFDNQRYLAILRQAGFQTNNFRDYMRVDMVRRQLSQSLIGTEFVLNSEAKDAHLMQQQTRDARYINISANKFADKVSVSDEQINSYYQANISQFDTEEKVALAYVELMLDDLLPNIDVTEDELTAYYQQYLADYRSEEERQVSHILFETAEQDAAIESKAQEVLERVQAGEDFAELAETFSSDTFSAENGGDLGWINRGVMEPAFEEAAFALENAGDVSDVVKSEFGYHIIKLTDVKSEQVTAFDEVREDIVVKVKTVKAEEQFYTVSQRMAEVAFEVPDNLDEVADIAGKSIQTTALFTSASAPEAVSHPNVVASAFGAELIEEGVNSEVLELGPNHVMVVRVAKHQAERTQSLDEVKPTIQQVLSAQGTQQAARDWALQVKTALGNGEDGTEMLSELALEWQQQQNIKRNDATLSQTILDALFALSVDASSVVDLVNGDVSLVQLVAVNPAESATEQQLQALKNRLASSKSQILYGAIVESLKAKADIEIF